MIYELYCWNQWCGVGVGVVESNFKVFRGIGVGVVELKKSGVGVGNLNFDSDSYSDSDSNYIMWFFKKFLK